MSLAYIRRTYSVPAFRGAEITFDGCGRFENCQGRITSSRGGYLRVLMSTGETVSLHPTWRVGYHEAPMARTMGRLDGN